jgi:branched-chain amino acid transport system substrate-binding protein
MVTQITVETMKRAKEKGKKIDRAALYEELLAMNGNNAYTPYTTVGPVTYSKTDKEGVDTLQLYAVKDGVFRAVGKPYAPEYYKKLK